MPGQSAAALSIFRFSGSSAAGKARKMGASANHVCGSV